jgi:aminoglycoside phosphotransferase family enzyme/predicted kinase
MACVKDSQHGNERKHLEPRELIRFLESAASYPHGPPDVRSIETHISWVFVASPFVFKVKKPVNLGFADFSLLEKRRHFCQREVELNRRLCSEVYLGVVPIFKTASGFSFESETWQSPLPTAGDLEVAAPSYGEIAEYCVKMKELPHGWFLNELLTKNLVGQAEINRVISRLHRFYQSQSPSPEIELWGTPEKLKISTDENFAQVEPFVGKTISPAALETVRRFTNRFYAVHEKLFRERIQQHRIRDCHGDLHLDHIHITPDTLSIFDCIEFNDRFRFIDTANDLAFLAMDFDFKGRSDLANLLLQNATREFRDDEMLRLTDFYKCYRAFVRGKVESIQATALPSPLPSPLGRGGRQSRRVRAPELVWERVGVREILSGKLDFGEHAEQAARYFRLALQYAIAGSERLVLVVMGPVGTGKTTVARQLGRELDWPVLSSDHIRKTLAGVPLTERTASEQRDRVYSEQMTEQTYKELLRQGFAALEKQGGVVLDATFSSRTYREFLRQECEKANVQLQVIELDAERATIASRLKARDQSVGEISDARLEDLEKLTAAYEPRSGGELTVELIKISANDSALDTVKAALLQLSEKRL